MKTINLSSTFGDSTKLSQLVDYQDALREEKTLKLNWKNTTELQPAGCAILACLAEIAIESKCKVKIQGVKKQLNNKQYIDFFASQVNQQKFDFLQWEILKKDFMLFGANGRVVTVFHDYLDQYFSLKDDENYNVRLILSELISNAVDHSGADRYFVYVSVQDKEINLGVLDMGVSIPKRLAQKYDYEDDMESLRQSVKLGISTRRERVGGRGLSVVFDILKNTKGKLTMLSGRAAIRRYFNTPTVKSYQFNSPLRGSWVFCRFRRQ